MPEQALRSVLLTTQETAEAERRAIEGGVPGYALMGRAGVAVAAACDGLPLERKRVSILCGPGNNGGDGLVVARLLASRDWTVSVFALDAERAWTGDAALARRDWTGPIRPSEEFAPEHADVIVDALFGAGLSRPLSGRVTEVVRRVNAAGVPVIAVDIPSGVDGSSGEVPGPAIEADLTVTFGTAKPGHYLYPGRGYRGRLEIADIGLTPSPGHPPTWVNGPAMWAQVFPWPDLDGHKYRRGHAVVVSGPLSQTGAARLAARSALRIGAGLVTLASPRDAVAVNAAHLTAVMLQAANGPEELGKLLDDRRKNAIVLGPGLGVGPATRLLVERALAPQPDRRPGELGRACLLDADALTSFAGQAGALADMIKTAPGPVVITPHDGEFARLFSANPVATQGSKLERARAAAALLGCVVLLKGADTVVADPAGPATIDDGGSPWLATAGSGDVLSGMIGGLMAQGMPGFAAATAGSYLHAEAARRFGPGLIAEDIPEQLPSVLNTLWGQAGLSAE